MAKTPKPQSAEGAPVKSFFVDVLTKDLSLLDAILDLLDNCVDGIIRAKGEIPEGDKPFVGFSAHIQFSEDEFSIEDNCGGMPKQRAIDYAFRMGRPRDASDDDGLPTVGTYGIGMKRAIFKIGREAVVESKHGKDSFSVDISPDWFLDESVDGWSFPIVDSPRDSEGTTVKIEQLTPNTRDMFAKNAKRFEDSLHKRIAEHYAYILEKGFEVRINETQVKAQPLKFRFVSNPAEEAIQPFIYEAEADGVEIYMAVGFWQPFVPVDEIVDGPNQTWKETKAGWTIICNHRVVTYCDRTELTGWGTTGVAAYHPQFAGIRGIVEFTSNDASKLPTTSTKHGLDASSLMYLQVKNRMVEGMKMFIQFTNRWKNQIKDAKKQIEDAPAISFTELKKATKSDEFRGSLKDVRRDPLGGISYKPPLPMPSQETKTKWIRFQRPESEIAEVGDYYFDNSSAPPSDVGDKCFQECLNWIRK